MSQRTANEDLKKTIEALEQDVAELRRSQARLLKETRALEESLSWNEKRWNVVLALTSDTITITRLRDGCFMHVNESFCRLTGYSEEEVIGRTALDLNLYADPADRDRLLGTLHENGHVEGRAIRFRIKNGTIRDDLVAASLIRFQDEECVICVNKSVTPLNEAQAALRESEESYRSVLALAPDAIIILRISDGRYVQVNDAFCRLTGYNAEEAIGRNNSDLNLYTDPNDGDRLMKGFRRDGYVEGMEVRFRAKNGTLMETLVSATPIQFKGEDCLLVMATGITSLKETQNALRQSEEKYRNILETMEEGYWETDLAGNFTFFNDSMCRIFGYARDELMGMNYKTYTSALESKRIFAIYSEMYRTGVPARAIDVEVIRRQGSVAMTETSVSPLKTATGEVIGFRGISRDRTEQREAERAMQESEEKYRLLVENSNEGIFITQDKVVKFPNSRTKALTGYTADELSRTPFLNLVHSDDRDLVQEVDGRRLEGEFGTNTSSLRIANRNGDTLWVELNRLSISWEGRPATLNFLRDVTPQKKMEAQLLQAKKMEAIGTLAGGIAHDFNNLLMGIQGNTSLVLLDIGSDHPHYQNLKSIEKLVKNGADLTRQLLGAARGGKYELRPVNLNPLIESSIDLFSRMKKEILIHKRFQGELWPVEVDPGQIEQVLLNLYVNAGHAMPEGGELFIETRNLTLDELEARPYGVAAGRFVRVSVTDTGLGMEEAVLRRVFDPFFTTKEMGRGTGLGLTSAYGIVRNHKGTITVYSEMGKGTTFKIYLPATGKKVVQEVERPKRIMEGSETILLVDDENVIIQVGRQLLERSGFRVVTAGGGKEAVEVYRKNRNGIDLVILDMIMPGMSGGETYSRLKEIDPKVTVLLSSGYSIDGQARKILNRGCEGFIQKPYNAAELSGKVRRVLDHRRS